MIYWFSATGNSKHAAERLSKLLDDDMMEITHETTISKNSPIIMVFPCFFWGVPHIIDDLFKRTLWEEKDRIYCVVTCGGTIGGCDNLIAGSVSPANSITYALPMETNYIIWHEIDDKDTIIEKLQQADLKIEEIATMIKEGVTGYKSSTMLAFLTKFFFSFYKKQHFTAKFQASEKCINCGICKENCPDGAIELKNRRPVWEKHTCQHCLKCLHNCPVECIEYGEKTVGKSRYLYSNYSLTEEK